MFDNVPSTIFVRDDEPIGAAIFTVSFSDANKKDTLAVSLLATTPQEDRFTLDPATGQSGATVMPTLPLNFIYCE